MDVERIRTLLLKLPHSVETMQWGGSLVFWVGDKAIGGKMFAWIRLDDNRKAVISYAAGPERYAELVEIEGLLPAPYLARVHWVAAERWDVFRPREWEVELRAAHDLTLYKLPLRTQKVLQLPAAELRHLIAERRKLLESRPASKKKTARTKSSPRPHRRTTPTP